jgi:hypothetical protein
LCGLPAFLLIWWRSPWSHNFCILYACKTSTMWVMPRSTASSSYSHNPL